MNINRRRALGWGITVWTATAAGVVTGGVANASVGSADQDGERSPATADGARDRIARVYRSQTARAGGTWSSMISVADQAGTPRVAVAESADRVVEAYSVNKLAVATAVLDKVDRGLIQLTDRVDVTAEIVIQDTDGIFALDGAYPSSVTVGHALATLLTVSDNTAVRLCGLVCPALELNDILRAKGFVHTRVVPVANPNRFFLGTTTPAETHTLLRTLVEGQLLSVASTEYLLTILRSLTSFTDGVRLTMSSNERLRVATKAGWFADGRNEAGVMFSEDGRPIVTYSLFAAGTFAGDQAENDENFSATHPAIAARAVLGRAMLDAVTRTTTTAPPRARPVYRMSNGG